MGQDDEQGAASATPGAQFDAEPLQVALREADHRCLDQNLLSPPN